MKKLAVLLIFLLLLPCTVPAQSSVVPEPSYIIMDRHTGEVLLSSGMNRRIFPASTTKILTALVALENARPTASFTASRKAVSAYEWGAVLLPIKEGEEMLLYDLLNALMLRSANDAANVIAEGVGGSVEHFLDMMNERAVSLGALDSSFSNTNGLHSEALYTTVNDLALITRAALNNNIFRTIVSQSEYNLSPTNMREEYIKVVNSNPILGINPGYDFIVLGVKTGYTSKANHVLVSHAEDNNGREVICVVASVRTREEIASMSLNLISRAFREFGFHSVAKPGDVVSETVVEGTSIPLAVSKSISHLLPNDVTRWVFNKEIVLYEPLATDIERGDILGEITYLYRDREIGSSYLVATVDYTPETGDGIPGGDIPGEKAGMEVSIYFIIFSLGAIMVLYIALELGRIERKMQEDRTI
ncbi:MAG: D-alanyl-D-alanine carboxypeptidase family protein [Clostridia bacterium]